MDSRSNILLNKNQILNLRLEQINGAVAPPAGWLGGMIFNTTDKRVYSYVGVDTVTADVAWGMNWKTWLYKGEARGELTLTNGWIYYGVGGVPVDKDPATLSRSVWGAPIGDISWGGFKITNLKDPTQPQDAATKFYVDTGDTNLKNYVDNLVQGLKIHDSCLCLTVGELACTHLAGVLTGTGNGPLNPSFLDGVTPLLNSRILVKNQALPAWNGIYTVTQLGLVGYSPWKLTRATDADSGVELLSAYVFIQQGTSFHDTGWVQTEETTALDPLWVIGSGPISWIQFSGSGTYTSGNGLVLVGNVFHFATSANYGVGSLFYANSATTVGQIPLATQFQPLLSDPARPTYSPNWRLTDTGLLEYKNSSTGFTGQLQFNPPLTANRTWALPDYTGFIPATDVKSPGVGRPLLSGPQNSGPCTWLGYALPASATADRLFYSDSAAAVSWGVIIGPWKTATLLPKVAARKFETVQAGDGTTNTITVLHDLNTRKVQVTLRYADATDSDVAREILYTQTDVMSLNTVRFTFATVQPTSKYYAVMIVG